mgnify:CR=1 FL=1
MKKVTFNLYMDKEEGEFNLVLTAGEVETIMEEERMGWCARRAFNISDDAE